MLANDLFALHLHIKLQASRLSAGSCNNPTYCSFIEIHEKLFLNNQNAMKPTLIIIMYCA